MIGMKFSKANAKIRALSKVADIQGYLKNNRKVYSFDLLSGHTCPYARDCHAKAMVRDNGTRFVQPGKHADFRCFSASQEAFYTPLFNLRKHNTDYILPIAAANKIKAGEIIVDSLPKNVGVVRIHVGGDFKTQNYFDAWLHAAKQRPDVLFYAYTKSIPFWVKRIAEIPENLILTASKGGMKDELIEKHNLRQAIVVDSEDEAMRLNLEIDHDDSHAVNPNKRNQSFALLIHGLQPAGSRWAKAIVNLRGKGSYSR